jgi:hypothetical protein
MIADVVVGSLTPWHQAPGDTGFAGIPVRDEVRLEKPLPPD